MARCENNIKGHLTCSLLFQNDDVDCACMVNIFFPPVLHTVVWDPGLGLGRGDLPLYGGSGGNALKSNS